MATAWSGWLFVEGKDVKLGRKRDEDSLGWVVVFQRRKDVRFGCKKDEDSLG